MKYALFDAEGLPTAFYTQDVHGPLEVDGERNLAYPDGTISITDDQWLDLISNQGKRRWTGVAVEPYEPPQPPPIVPSSATKLGLKRALTEIGQWASVKAAIGSDPDLQEDWDLATEIRRSDPLTQAMIASLQLTEAQVDQLLVRSAALIA